MHTRKAISAELTRLAELQAGVVTAEQAVALGQSRHSVARLLDSGQWFRLATGLYRTVPVAVDFAGLAWGGVRRSARTVGSPPRLGLEETVIDLAALSRDSEVVGLVTRAVQTRRTTAARLAAALARRGRHRHRALLQAMLSDVAEGAESALELIYLREVERPHGLPIGDRQKSWLGLPYCTDVGYDDYLLLVELDGRDGHEGTGRFRHMRRDNRFAAGGLTTLRYGFFAVVDHPCAVAGQVWAMLAERGRPEPFQHCPRCLATPLAELIRG